LPEEWLIEWIQQVGTNSRNLLSPSFVAIGRRIATVFRNLRDIFVTDAVTSRGGRKKLASALPDAPTGKWGSRQFDQPGFGKDFKSTITLFPGRGS
jgi:hypothetical protein